MKLQHAHMYMHVFDIIEPVILSHSVIYLPWQKVWLAKYNGFTVSGLMARGKLLPDQSY